MPTRTTHSTLSTSEAFYPLYLGFLGRCLHLMNAYGRVGARIRGYAACRRCGASSGTATLQQSFCSGCCTSSTSVAVLSLTISPLNLRLCLRRLGGSANAGSAMSSLMGVFKQQVSLCCPASCTASRSASRALATIALRRSPYCYCLYFIRHGSVEHLFAASWRTCCSDAACSPHACRPAKTTMEMRSKATCCHRWRTRSQASTSRPPCWPSLPRRS